MNTLAKHIETLLLNHDCVMVQGLGGFIAMKKPAHFVADEGVFYPPYRSVTFNQQLTYGDGLLEQLYMQSYDASYPQALLQIEKDVEELMTDLDLNGSVEIGNIGELHKDLDNRIILESYVSGIDSPALYGLGALGITTWKKQKPAKKEEETKIVEMVVPEEKPEHKIPFMYDMSVAAAIAAIFFLLFASPMSNSSQYEEEAYIAGMGGAAALVNQQNQQKEIVAGDFTIVLACYVSEKNANNFIESLSEAGYEDGQFIDGKKTMIVYGKYASETEAMNSLKELREGNKAFADGWVLQVK
jgi:hypothetical protein